MTPEELLKKHGICKECGELIEHHLDEPFASCRCGTSEWYEFTPHMRLQAYVDERNKLIAPLIIENNLLKTKLKALENLHHNYRQAIRQHLDEIHKG